MADAPPSPRRKRFDEQELQRLDATDEHEGTAPAEVIPGDRPADPDRQFAVAGAARDPRGSIAELSDDDMLDGLGG